MDNGFYVKEMRIKEGALPIDNVTKFVWADDDYEEVEEFIPFTVEQKIAMLKGNLAETDYIAYKAMDAILSCSNVVDLFSAIKSIGEEYGDKISLRKKWREQINELENKE